MARGYVEVEIVADEELNEHLIGIMSQLGFEGFWEDGRILRCYMGRGRWTREMLSEISSVARIMARASASASPQLSVKTLPEQNWNEEWEKTIHPIHVTERIVITPSWQKYVPGKGEIVLTIDPKMSFGTGYHETTRLVLRLMEKHLRPGMTLLDVGTGTGVLAIAGARLGAASAIGLDNDEWSYRNATENSHANGVDDQVKIVFGDISAVRGEKFDMIAANLQMNLITEMLGKITASLSSNGVLLLSGLLVTDRESIIRDLTGSRLELTEEASENEWMAIVASPTRGL